MDYIKIANEMNDEILKLREQLEVMTTCRDHWKNSYWGFKMKLETTNKQLEVAEEGIKRAANLVGGDYDDVSDMDRMDGTEKILTDALAEIDRIGKDT